MEKQRIQLLLDKYTANLLTSEEFAELSQLCQAGQAGEISDLIAQVLFENQEELAAAPREPQQARILDNILSIDKKGDWMIETMQKRAGRYLGRWGWMAAASVVFMLGIAGYLFFAGRESGRHVAAVAQVNPSNPVNYTRNLVLPDGSRVVLGKNSTLTYTSSFSNGTVREVQLSGEAYFDIVHKNTADATAEPFIIHTGKIKTVVLGTAFNVKAYPGQQNITVSVTRGKVRVEDGHKVLGVLTKNEQITYNVNRSEPRLASVNAERSLEWARTEMEFDGATFGKIAEVLEKRYGVEIVFKNRELADCQIVSSFSGTENLENVLETLCTVLNASFQTGIDNRITIDGQPCQTH